MHPRKPKNDQHGMPASDSEEEIVKFINSAGTIAHLQIVVTCPSQEEAKAIGKLIRAMPDIHKALSYMKTKANEQFTEGKSLSAVSFAYLDSADKLRSALGLRGE